MFSCFLILPVIFKSKVWHTKTYVIFKSNLQLNILPSLNYTFVYNSFVKIGILQLLHFCTIHLITVFCIYFKIRAFSLL